MARHHTPAIILRTVDYGDSHVVVHLLGRDTGRMSAIAFGGRKSKRRFAGGLEPLRIVDATYTTQKSRDLHRLDELDVIESFPGIEERIETITAASYGTELVRETWREGEEARPVFELLRKFYRHLPPCPSTKAIARLTHQFEYQLLRLYGLAPSIHHCARCGISPQKMDKLRLSRRGEGLICGGCRHRSDLVGVITDETLAILHHLHDPDSPLPSSGVDTAIAQTGRVMANAIDQLVERPLTSRQMLMSLL